MAGKQKNTDAKPPIWEWILAAIGLVMVISVIGSMLYRAATQDKSPPNLEVVVTAVTATASSHHVEFEVKNTGNRSAAAVIVEADLLKGGQSVETSTAALAYVPANSVRSGGLYFSRNPNDLELKMRVTGYEKP